LNPRASFTLLVALLVPGFLPAGPHQLPVHFSDDHAESFAWIVETFPLHQPHTLVLIDAHSDATAVSHSDAVRARMAVGELPLCDLRKTGRIQAYNWIEPLMPRPIGQVIWVAGNRLTSEERQRHQAKAAAQLDARLEFEARSAGPFGSRWTVADASQLVELRLDAQPVIVSIDLDFFSGMEPEQAARSFDRLWHWALSEPGLAGISFAISRPWLRSDEEANRLLGMALNAVFSVRNTTVSITPTFDVPIDDSRRAAEYSERGQPVPRFDWTNPAAAIASRLAAHASRITPTQETSEAWQSLSGSFPRGRLTIDGEPRSIDGLWHVEAGKDLVLRADAEGATGRVQWFERLPTADTYDLLPETGLGKGFTRSAGKWIRETTVPLGETHDAALALPAQAGESGWGRRRFEALVETDHGWVQTPVLELAAGTGSGFRRALSEQFRLPYTFGIGRMRDGILTGPELGWGNDCANFLVAAWRSQGCRLNWCDPSGLRAQLEPTATIEPGDVARGVAVDFGNHMAALWEDLPPTGKLGPEDTVVHHLGGTPEKVPLGKLLERYPKWSLWKLPKKEGIRIRFGGDVVPTDQEQDLREIQRWSHDSEALVVNLEGVIGEPTAARSGRFSFLFPADRLKALAEAGVSGVVVANNHAGDAGLEGLHETARTARAAGVAVAGIYPPRGVEIHEQAPRVILFAASLFKDGRLPREKGIVTLPRDADALFTAIAAQSTSDACVVLYVHGGTEYDDEPNQVQEYWARQAIERGVDVVVMSHPHRVQPLEFYAGRPVAFSLGNLIYPTELRGADNGAILDLLLDDHGNLFELEITQLRD